VRGSEHGSVEVSDRATGVVVVGHDIDEIEQRHDSLDLEIGDLGWPRRGGDGQLVVMPVAPSLLVEPATELRQQQREVLLVGRPFDISLETALHRKLPIDVDAVEETRPSSNEEVNCG